MTEVTLLDGSIGQELVKRGSGAATPLWSTKVMMDEPELVGAVHADYFGCGATIATTNTYAVHRNRLERVDLEDQLAPLLHTAVDQAVAARDAHGSGRIAGALGPLLATYRPDLKPDVALATERFAEIINLMGDRIDLVLAETVSSLQEAEGIFQGYQASGSGKPLWVGFSVDDDDGTKLRSGEPLDVAVAMIAHYRPAAVLLNCSLPEAISNGLPILSDCGIPFGAFANGFTKISDDFKKDAPTVDALSARTDLTPARYADQVMEWVGAGATIVGGCCEVGPDHISEIARRLTDAGHTIV
ncbi:homocysteine S-methyltransferase family protein [Sulfitobacter donghicola]|uniref:Homocysteine S-methyltransferase n=1 Tax=Sulfitobacter donghicola DSW-25 = KCTC 12864 = JCM 14565 TaxID=1300350 RepID=A0A073IJA8_9RHOB|nr:homocysteine S-methyltransferase family protein [Sulfitobacter donghicola]KEJ90403.1 homocysteine S-methyltransferase [Sulfitobacter donghicola DSW-25 = KCTC 12864 = JCM 14565]KIN67632.1 Homocysteine S-methyltransferase family protein [Sulfitobacter donghicola DSW-25 = KCTC 12864 = JCM 14565]